jgi:formylmethanofuran dehydrogenase subunit C
MTTLRLEHQSDVPLEAESISPDRFLGKNAAEIAALPLIVGNRAACLGDYFAVHEDGTATIVLEGDLARVKQIGAGMTQGQIEIRGNAGMHLGASMRGGSIDVHGNAGDWAGAEMRGGQIHIRGNAGHGLGGAYRGSPKGMNRGLIIVDGHAGNEAGSAMRRGLIVIGGDSGDFTGAFMIAGTILVGGRLGGRTGAGLKRGTILAFEPPQLLPSFRYACTFSPPYVNLLLRHLRSVGLAIPDAWMMGRYRRYNGDLAALGKGEILVWEEA